MVKTKLHGIGRSAKYAVLLIGSTFFGRSGLFPSKFHVKKIWVLIRAC